MEHTLDKLQKAVHEALRAGHAQDVSPPSSLNDLLLVQERRAALARKNDASGAGQAIYDVLFEALEALAQEDETAARVLRQRFVDGDTILMVAHRLNVSEHTVSRLQRMALARLTAILHDRESALRAQRAQTLEASLPPATYTRLFGIDEVRDALIGDLQQEDGPGVVAIVGIGGVGKTAVADAVTRTLIPMTTFDDVLWLRFESRTMTGEALSAEHALETLLDDLVAGLDLERSAASTTERAAAIRRRLKSGRHLVVVDNLENEAVADYLLNHLMGMAVPSKFLLTMRARATGQAAVRHVSLPELSFEDAARLVRHHAADVGVEVAVGAEDEDVARIYDVTGGNPLALKLVVGLLDSLPLGQVLAQLAHRPTGAVEGLYRHIYWQAWQTLSDPARTLLQAMPMVAQSGGDPQYLMTISGLPEATFWLAVQQLRARSLLEVRGTLEQKRYGVHRLTETFVRSEIMHWPEE